MRAFVLGFGLLVAVGCDLDGEAPEEEGMPCESTFDPENLPLQIDAYTWNGREVYGVSMDCCDQFNTVLDAETCEYICASSGGITGAGDGQCPDFDAQATHQGTVWTRPAAE